VDTEDMNWPAGTGPDAAANKPAKRVARRGRSSATAIAHAEREREAIVLRRAVLSYDEIAQRVGYRDRSGAKKAVERGLSRWMREADEELRAVMLDRCECLVARLWPLLDCGYPDLKTVAAFLKLTDLEARLSGAYAPRRQHLDVAVHARVEHAKIEALRVLEADPDIADVIDGYLDDATTEPSDE
jgi:hypothetical protein